LRPKILRVLCFVISLSHFLYRLHAFKHRGQTNYDLDKEQATSY
jgi:hypothetical protein